MTNYLVDVYLLYAASVLAANAVLRSLFGAAFPLFTVSLFAKLGTQWALTLFAFLSLACVPIPFLFMKYGHVIRKHSNFAPGHPAAVLPANAVLGRVVTRQQSIRAEEIRVADLRQEEAK